jgi:hypothetical protein
MHFALQNTGVCMVNSRKPRPYGLSALAKANDALPGSVSSRAPGTILGRWEVTGPKRWGVEPGFEARKRWTAADTQKLFTPDHKYFHAATAYLGKARGPGADDQTSSGVAARIALRQSEIIHYLQQAFRKFQATHYIKMDYAPPGNDGRVRRGAERHKGHGPPFMRPLTRKIHNNWTAKTPRQINLIAIKECLANDLLALLGEPLGLLTQKLKLLPSSYPDGSPKLLLDGKHLESEDAIESFCDFSGCLVDGYLVKKPSGPQLLADDSLALGRFKALMLLLADRDSLGRDGDNKGRVGNRFAAIDPGKALPLKPTTALETDYMAYENIYDDLSLRPPSRPLDMLSGGYRHFSVFDDCPLSEKLLGVKRIADVSQTNEDRHVFEAYIEEFSSGVGPLNFSSELNALKERYLQRRAYLLRLFSARLAFIHRPDLLDFVDHLEKLTSQTAETSPHNQVKLHFLRVIQRVAWELKKQDSHYLFSMVERNPGLGDLAYQLLQEYFQYLGVFDEVSLERLGPRICIKMAAPQLDHVLTRSSYRAVAEYKQQLATASRFAFFINR